MTQLSLSDAIERHIRPGDSIQVVLGHSRWTAAARELTRQFWGRDPGFTLVMTSLGALSALFFRGEMLRHVITTYSGDTFPTYGPNPIFAEAYQSGAVTVEHWSILTLVQRLEAAARGLPAAVTGSIVGSSMERNEAFSVVPSEHGPLGILAPLAPDVALIHGAVADAEGNVALSEPLLEGVWGCWAARRGVIATVEKVVESLDGYGHRVRIPAHRVLAVVETPFGAHPGGCFAQGLPVRSYGEDIAFWTQASRASRGDFDAFAHQYALEPKDQDAYLAAIGEEKLRWLEGRSAPDSWHADDAAHPLPESEPISPWERAATFGVREVEAAIGRHDADAVLAGAGVANLAAWVAVGRARAAGHPVKLTAELGLLGYTPTPADPYIFNHRVFPSTSLLGDASTVLGMVIGGPGTTTIGCLGAAEVDAEGNLNSTLLTGGRFLVGSGGANDVASRAKACVVVTLARPERLPAKVAYVTSPGRHVESVVTDKGVLRRVEGRLRIAAVPRGEDSVADRISALMAACGWSPEVLPNVDELDEVTESEVLALRQFDRERLFLR